VKWVESEKKYASDANFDSPDRRGRSVVVGESLHSYAKHDQVDLERRCGHCRGVVAPEYLWTISLFGQHSGRNLEVRVNTVASRISIL
jgi:hypothetical protein